ncbi:MAG: hypothetical protein IKX23_01535 [Treponema sp.]|nr:hypothetical protein [Treponema sp.]
MKRFILSLFMISFVCIFISAQEENTKKYMFTVAGDSTEVNQEQEDSQSEEKETEQFSVDTAGDSAETAFSDPFFKDVINLVEKEKPVFTVASTAEANLKEVEDCKKRLYKILSAYNSLVEAFNKDVDNQTEAECKAIYAEEYTSVELEADGKPSDDAIKRREERCNIIRDEARAKKEAYAEEQRALIAEDEKKERTYLAASYKVLESGKYVVTSYTDNVKLSIGKFDGGKGAWLVGISSNLCGKEVVNFETYLDYADVTGEKFIPADKMSISQMNAFNKEVERYDTLFKLCPDIFCVRINYDVLRWKQNSEYRYVPSRIEIINIARKNKIIRRFVKGDVKPRLFVIEDGAEIRTKEEIEEDVLKFNKQLAKEARENQTEADKLYQQYSESYQNEKNNSNKLPVIQKGRGAFVISVSPFVSGDEMSGSADFGIDVLNLELCIPAGKYFFWGFDAGVYFPLGHGIFDMQFGILGGVNCQITHLFRPYIKLNLDFDTKLNGIIQTGAGLDFTIANVFLVNLGYSYNWAFDHNNKLNDETPEDQKDIFPVSQYHKFSIGLGIFW